MYIVVGVLICVLCHAKGYPRQGAPCVLTQRVGRGALRLCSNKPYLSVSWIPYFQPGRVKRDKGAPGHHRKGCAVRAHAGNRLRDAVLHVPLGAAAQPRIH